MAIPASPNPTDGPPWLVLAGASGADGMRQLIDFVAALPAGLPAAVAVVLHRPAGRLSQLPAILRRSSHLPVLIPEDGQHLAAGCCYLADSDHHLALGPDDTVRLVADHLYRNRTIDLLFASAAEEAGERVIGIVLAGQLRDGSQGLAAISRAGGTAFVIDSVWASSEGMPRAAALAVPDAVKVGSSTGLAAAVTQLVSARAAEPKARRS